MSGAAGRQRPLKEALTAAQRAERRPSYGSGTDSSFKSRNESRSPSPSYPSPRKPSLICISDNSQTVLQTVMLELLLKHLERAPSRFSSGSAMPSRSARGASALTQFAEHVERDRGEMVSEKSSQGDPCLSLHTTLVWNIALHE
jgi:hypothetical protein